MVGLPCAIAGAASAPTAIPAAAFVINERRSIELSPISEMF